ncbi:hypothetical protein OSB04_un000372 [Centaurea solstitialis]|uniref:Microspherule protein N-terminal domain-containing protein n=1 Tax=Centaurea solstitialis TaxID=347529 RepID=A0AA38W3R3_9ASTR|nr:hypothetical protein OSB04_un000372 [Centaurea solstitialis]
MQAGISTESLARGVVQFLKRFTIQELQDRWHAILYDPVVAAEAFACMLEFEHSASAPISNSAQLNNIEENVSVSGKRKAESVRQLYYAMRKRMQDHLSNSLDLSFQNTTVNSNGNGNEYHPPAADFVLGELVLDNQATGFSTYEAAGHDDLNHDAHQSQDNISLLENNASVEDSDEFREIYDYDLLEDEGTELPGIMDQPHNDKLNEYPVIRGEGNLHLPYPDCQDAIQNPGPSSTFQQMPVWSTNDSCSSTSSRIHIKEEQQSMARTSDFPGSVYLGAAKLENQMCGETTTGMNSLIIIMLLFVHNLVTRVGLKVAICRSDLFPAPEKAVAIKSEQEMHNCSPVSTALENKSGGSDVFANSPQLKAVVGNHDVLANASVQNEEILHAEIASTEDPNANLVVRHSPTDEEALSSLSDDDIRNFSDIEAMVLIGRATEDVQVDIDLGRDGQNSRVSRRQVCYHLTTILQIRGMPFLFETNEACIKQYVDNINKSDMEEKKRRGVNDLKV